MFYPHENQQPTAKSQKPKAKSQKPKAVAFLCALCGLILLFLPRQLRRRIVNLAAAGFYHFVAERCSVFFLARQSIGLALVIPALGIQALRLLEVRNRF